MTNLNTTPVNVTTDLGAIRGTSTGGVARFAGIPYAEAPTGELRFRPPRQKTPWDGEFDATEFGPVCPQNPSFMDIMFGLAPEPQDEDCLRLNVYAPASALGGPHRLPVMVWIHGGAFEMGSGSTSIYDGAPFADQGVVFVSINYRLGALGYLELGGLDPSFAGSGNCGFLDQVEALRWVNRHIEHFGGDPGRVTVFGESAGSMSTALLLASPLTDGLIHQAICQSGGLNIVREVDFARAEGADFVNRGGWDSVEAAQAAPLSELLAVHAHIAAERWGNPEETLRTSGSPTAAIAFRPVADGMSIPIDPLAAVADGAASGVRVLAGHNDEEWRLFAMLMPSAADEEALRNRISLLHADVESVMAAYRIDHPDATPGQIESAILTDVLFRVPTAELLDAQARHAPVWQYQFDWKSPAIGAAHAVELPFVFEQLHDTRLAPLFGEAPPFGLATSMNTAWARFAIDGSPAGADVDDWPAVTGDGPRAVLRFDSENRLDHDPASTSLTFWS